MNNRTAFVFKLALALMLAEILLIAVTTLRAAPPAAPLYAGALWTLLKVAPLLAVLPSLRRGSARAAIVLCFLLCFYFLGAVLSAAAPPPQRWLGLFEVLVVAAGFVAALLAARWAHRPTADAAGPAPGADP